MNLSKTTVVRTSLVATCLAFFSFGCAAESGEDAAEEGTDSVTSEVSTQMLVPLKGFETARTTAALNLRMGPSTGYQPRLVIPAGATVTYARDWARYVRNGYAPVYFGNTGGWAYVTYLSRNAPEQGGEQPEQSATPSVYGMGCVGRATANYCGGNFGVQGDPNILFRCENGYRTAVQYCRSGCASYNWVGSPDDHCR